MVVHGEWHECPDGITRPIIRADVQKSDGSWLSAELLVDTGADRTVLSGQVIFATKLPATPNPGLLGGFGGVANTILVNTVVRLTSRDGSIANVQARFAAVDTEEALDMSILGRDILNIFSVFVDYRGNQVLLIDRNHRVRVEPIT